MTPAANKPREWWIIDSLMSGRTWISEGPLNPNHQEKAHEIHVVEYSAYAKAIAALKCIEDMAIVHVSTNPETTLPKQPGAIVSNNIETGGDLNE